MDQSIPGDRMGGDTSGHTAWTIVPLNLAHRAGLLHRNMESLEAHISKLRGAAEALEREIRDARPLDAGAAPARAAPADGAPVERAVISDDLTRAVLDWLRDQSYPKGYVLTSAEAMAQALGKAPEIICMALRALSHRGAIGVTPWFVPGAPGDGLEGSRIELRPPFQAAQGFLAVCAKLKAPDAIAKAVLMALARRADANGGAVVPIHTLADETGMAAYDAGKALARLRAAGLLARRYRTRPRGSPAVSEHIVLAGPAQHAHAARCAAAAKPGDVIYTPQPGEAA